MKKAILAALVFIVVGFALVNGTFALPDLDKVFAYVKELGETLGLPQTGGAGSTVDVALVSSDTPQQLYPGGAASRATAVKNQGTSAVYFRLCYALQYDESSWDKLTITFAADDYAQTDWLDITIGTTPYKMKVFTYPEALAIGAESPDVTLTIAMGSTVTNEEIGRYRADFLQTQVLAIDPKPFTAQNITTAEEALNLALPLGTLNPF